MDQTQVPEKHANCASIPRQDCLTSRNLVSIGFFYRHLDFVALRLEPVMDIDPIVGCRHVETFLSIGPKVFHIDPALISWSVDLWEVNNLTHMCDRNKVTARATQTLSEAPPLAAIAHQTIYLGCSGVIQTTAS